MFSYCSITQAFTSRVKTRKLNIAFLRKGRDVVDLIEMTIYIYNI